MFIPFGIPCFKLVFCLYLSKLHKGIFSTNIGVCLTSFPQLVENIVEILGFKGFFQYASCQNLLKNVSVIFITKLHIVINVEKIIISKSLLTDDFA